MGVDLLGVLGVLMLISFSFRFVIRRRLGKMPQAAVHPQLLLRSVVQVRKEKPPPG
jgi:hypothetical protein